MYTYFTIRKIFLATIGLLAFTSCNGILEDIYDEPQEVVPVEGQLIIDATDWENWYYIDLPKLHELSESGDKEGLMIAQTTHTPYPIPMTLTGAHDGKSGQYLYWFDVWGEGLKNNKFQEFTPCDAQPEPESWSFAVHRNNVRTNGGGVYETEYTSMSELPESSSAFEKARFTEDEWSENEVWDSQEKMLLSLVPSQGIEINKVLSSWLAMSIPPVPPAFHHNSHIFILRMRDGTYAALQLADYISSEGTKCWLTINYKYPY